MDEVAAMRVRAPGGRSKPWSVGVPLGARLGPSPVEWLDVHDDLERFASDANRLPTPDELATSLVSTRACADSSTRAAAYAVAPLLVLASRMESGAETVLLDTVAYVLSRPHLTDEEWNGIATDVQKRRRSGQLASRRVMRQRAQDRDLDVVVDLLRGVRRGPWPDLVRRLDEEMSDCGRIPVPEDLHAAARELAIAADASPGKAGFAVAPLLALASRVSTDLTPILTPIEDLLRSTRLSEQVYAGIAGAVRQAVVKGLGQWTPLAERAGAAGFSATERLVRDTIAAAVVQSEDAMRSEPVGSSDGGAHRG
jgi:hypothetical protein